MPYKSNEVGKVKEDIPSLKNFSDSKVRQFIKIFNSLLKDGMAEKQAIPLAISQIKKSDVSKSENSLSTENNVSKDFIKSLTSLITKHFGDSNPSIREITKFNEEEMVAIEPLYCGVGEADLHEEGMTEEEIRKMVDNINENIENIHGNIGHVFNTDGFYFVKAWVNECECKIGDEVVLEGQPIIKVQFTDKSLWEHRKSGKLQGLSIGALGLKEENPNYEGDESDE